MELYSLLVGHSDQLDPAEALSLQLSGPKNQVLAGLDEQTQVPAAESLQTAVSAVAVGNLLALNITFFIIKKIL
jgi:hypothetical protein